MNPVAEKSINEVLKEVLARYDAGPSSLISVLQDLQEDLSYLPREALDGVSQALGVPHAQIYHVATFYKAFSLKPRGRHTISVCRGTACHVKGVSKVADMLHAELGIQAGDTTADGMFTVQDVRCLGCCSLAPAIMIDGEVFGGVTPSGLKKILKRYCEDK